MKKTSPFSKQILEICKVCAAYYGRTPDQILNREDEQNVNRARKVAMYLSRELTGQSFPRIAREFDGRHHTTIMSAYRKMKNWVNKFPEVRNQVFAVKEILEERNIYDISVPAGFQILKSSYKKHRSPKSGFSGIQSTYSGGGVF